MTGIEGIARRDAPRRTLFRSIRTRLAVCFSLLFAVVLVIVVLLGLGGVPFSTYAGRIAAEKTEAFRGLNLIADIKKERLLRWLKERRDDAHVRARNPLVAGAVARLQGMFRERAEDGGLSPDEWNVLRKESTYVALLEFFKDVQATYGVYDTIRIADVNTGRVILSTDEDGLGTDASRFTPFVEVVRSSDDYVGDIGSGEKGYPVLHVAHIIYGDTGEPIAALLLEIHADDIIGPMLHTGEGLGRTGETVLVNGDVRILTSLRHPLPDGTNPRPLEYRIRAEPAVLAASGEEGVIDAEDYRGEPVLAAYRHIRVTPEFGWGMVVKRDKSDLFGPMRSDVAFTAWTGLLGIIAVVALTSILVRRLTGPIVSLGRTAERVADGDLEARALVTGSDEVGALAITFNSMVDRIQNWRQDLKEQVAARTVELDKANQELRAEMVERERAEAELRDSEMRSRTLLEGSPVCNKIIDLDSRLQYMSAAGLKQLKIPDIKPFYGCTYPPDFYPESMRTPLIEHLERAKAGEICSVECPVLDTEGCEVWYHTTFVPARDNEGRIKYIIASSVDITQRKRAEEAARTAQEQLLEQQRGETQRVQTELEKTRGQLITHTRLASIGQVAASIAHELRNPLGAARNAAYYLKRYTAHPEADIVEHLDIIDEEINTADRIITDLMNMTRSRPLDMEEVDLGQVIQEASKRVALPEGVGLRVTLSPDPFVLDADPGQMRQVIGNLLTNAAQVLQKNGEIVVEAMREKGCYEIEIRDNGPGIAAEHRGRVFEPLFTTKAKGTGLGLTICRGIVERHGGTIELVDDGQPGAVFRIRLPR